MNLLSPRWLHRAALSACILLAGVASSHSQSLFGGGKNSVDDRLVVAFPKKHAPGQIIVSFGDRRLYHIVAKGRAISYPIARSICAR